MEESLVQENNNLVKPAEYKFSENEPPAKVFLQADLTETPELVNCLAEVLRLSPNSGSAFRAEYFTRSLDEDGEAGPGGLIYSNNIRNHDDLLGAAETKYGIFVHRATGGATELEIKNEIGLFEGGRQIPNHLQVKVRFNSPYNAAQMERETSTVLELTKKATKEAGVGFPIRLEILDSNRTSEDALPLRRVYLGWTHQPSFDLNQILTEAKPAESKSSHLPAWVRRALNSRNKKSQPIS